MRQRASPLVVLGNFKYRTNFAGDDMWADLDERLPDPTKHTEDLTSLVNAERTFLRSAEVNFPT